MIAADQYEKLTLSIIKVVTEHEHHGRWHEAIHTLKMGLKMTRGARHNKKYEAQLQARLGGLLLKQGEFGTALALIKKAKATAEQVDDAAALAIALYHLGELHYVKCFAMLVGNHYQTLDYHTQALRLRETLQDDKGVVQSLNRIGLIYERLGEEEQAAAYYAQAMQLSEKIGYQDGLTRPAARVGIYHQMRGEWPKAQQYAQYVLVIRTETQDQEGLIFALHQMATITMQWCKNFGRAMAYARQALAIAEELEFKLAIAQTLFLIGRLYEMNGQQTDAVAYFLDTAELADAYHFESISRPALAKIATRRAPVECLN